MEILVVEDDARMSALLKRGLESEGHVVTLAEDGVAGLDCALDHDFDVMLLDVMIPEIDGLSVARRLRQRGSRVPILMLTARDSSRDVVEGLDTGADDYLTKPFAFDELLARIRALSRRGPLSRQAVLTFADVKLDPATHEAWRGERKLDLTPKEFQILELLLRRPGKVLSRDAIIESVWGNDTDVEFNTVDVFVSSLRRKLGPPHGSDRNLIRTARGVGFALKDEDP